jgi:hypothetical protein
MTDMNSQSNELFGIRRSTILIISFALAIGSFSAWKAVGGGSATAARISVSGTALAAGGDKSPSVVAGLQTKPHSSTVRSPAAHTTASLGSAILTKADADAAHHPTSVMAGLPTEPPRAVRTALTPIEQIQVGDRVLAESPTGEEDTTFGSEIIPADWRKLTLRAPKRDGTVANVVLLRPLTWLNEQHGKVGGTVFISVPECGIDGNAQVLAIDPCPEIHSGAGRVVTGTFLHQARSTITLTIAGQSESIECTGNHPFWSEDRQTFVRADSLEPNETLRTATGLTTVESWTPDLNPTPVYNIEVHGAHVYHVGTSGVVVHNPSGLSIANPCLYPEIPELGLGFTDNLDRFKKQFPGILDYDDLGLNPYSKFFPKQLESLMDGAGVIRFDVSGMRGLTGPDGVLTGPAFLNSLGSTNWELRTIFDNPALRAKTLIYNNGVLSSFEELLRMR